ncbi:putative transketolase TktA [Coemansia reversa NRRL 1564]|uniref:Transketolase n=1 Tax=Coemansia reversa (strain ATCC 12441 / NRRL 1564) TaxID=763665 RepID=A0A2G5B502_COERN|nr:putative transketolase TktA [Coemansia reversa NRRL 1564]|eukprot:PIA14098.1 putative transketolase TktA [Coemansia reversa NRRL 1564]
MTNVDQLSIDTIRVVAADMVQAAKSGHPGAPMGCAPMAHVLFSRVLNANPKNSEWFNRDRFVLSNGHGCALQYVLLHLLGYKVSMGDLKNFRQMDSVTPGHPEKTHTEGVEVTTGPLGQGISNAVGMALAERHLGAVFNRPNFPVINNTVYAIAGDGCLQEGVASEACSLAGHLQLGNLVVLYDSNGIQIDGSTKLGFTENVLQRFEAYGWHTQSVADGDRDLDGIHRAITVAKAEKTRPSIIEITTTIGYGAAKAGTAGVHGSALGEDSLAAVKTLFGFNPKERFVVADDVYKFYQQRAEEGAQKEKEWNELVAKYAKAHPDLHADLTRRIAGKLPDGWESVLPRYTPEDKPEATRKLSETVITALAEKIPELISGSADLTGSNLARWPSAVDFQPETTQLGDYAGRYVRYGVREHGMAAICNGMAAYGGVIPFNSTFLNFISYAAGASRLSALSRLRVVYVATHDSIGLGEDGPTHQPIETFAMLRATPNFLNFRPADGNEVSGAYIAALQHIHTPTVVSLTRQPVPQLEGSSIENTLKGGYSLKTYGSGQKPDLLIAATGSETSIAVDTAKLLVEKNGLTVKVVSMPCLELFDQQPDDYRHSVLTPGVPSISVEALSTHGWHKYVHHPIGMTTFGASGPYKQLYEHFGFVPEVIAKKALNIVDYYKNVPVPTLDLQF